MTEPKQLPMIIWISWSGTDVEDDEVVEIEVVNLVVDVVVLWGQQV